MYYFAYGSNMNIKHLQNYVKDCNAMVVGIGLLNNYIFKYQTIKNDYSCRRSRANIVKRKGSKVYGIIFNIDDYILNMLNKKEGVSEKRYKKIRVSVKSGDKTYNCMTYTMVGVCKDKDPPIRYRKLVVDAGMMFNFPSNYMKRLSLA